MADRQWEARALELARSVLGRTRPNPAVGAVLVRDDTVVGEGATQPAGGPHAEIIALGAAGERARGATLYVTLEPCCHHGRTPPCTDAIWATGVAEVRYAIGDPNPQVAGQGDCLLRSAGIRVIPGRGWWAEEARRLNEAYVHWVKTRRPFVVAKWAMSLDGRIATHSGDSRWITGEEARHPCGCDRFWNDQAPWGDPRGAFVVSVARHRLQRARRARRCGMFTGIVEEMGAVRYLGPAQERDGIDLVLRSAVARVGAYGVGAYCIRPGDSIAVGGVCLTVTALDDAGFTVGLAPETLRRTALGDLQQGDPVNLERALPIHGRFGGHIVQGHVDGVATVAQLTEEGDALWMTFAAPAEILRYIVYKGYVAVNGVSLTVAALDASSFSVQLVDHSRRHVDLGAMRPGTRVNVEVDVLGKYVEKLLGAAPAALVTGRAS